MFFSLDKDSQRFSLQVMYRIDERYKLMRDTAYLKFNNDMNLQAFSTVFDTFSQHCFRAHFLNATKAVITQDNLIGF